MRILYAKDSELLNQHPLMKFISITKVGNHEKIDQFCQK